MEIYHVKKFKNYCMQMNDWRMHDDFITVHTMLFIEKKEKKKKNVNQIIK